MTKKSSPTLPAPVAIPLALQATTDQAIAIAPGVGIEPAKLADIVRAVVLEFAESLPEQKTSEELSRIRHRRGRQYAVRLKDRMKKFHSIYNAAWFVRHAEAGETSYRKEKMRAFWQTVADELNGCKDIEALTYAVADALSCYRYGFPWEG